jgi:hypothetical protein
VSRVAQPLQAVAASAVAHAKWLVVGRADHRHRLHRSTAIKLARGASSGVIVVR